MGTSEQLEPREVGPDPVSPSISTPQELVGPMRGYLDNLKVQFIAWQKAEEVKTAKDIPPYWEL